MTHGRGTPPTHAVHKIHPDLLTLAVAVDQLVPDPRNLRLHDERNLREVERSYAEHGQRKPVVAQRRTSPHAECGGTGIRTVPMDGFNPTGAAPCSCDAGRTTELVVRAGNGQLTAARRLGWTHIAAVVVDEGDHEAVRYAVRDNRTAELAEWDWEMMTREMVSLEQAGGAGTFAELGFSETELLPLRNTEWFLQATGQLEDHQRGGKDKDPDPDKAKEQVTIVGRDATDFTSAAAVMRDRFAEPGMNLGHVVGRLARHYLATVNHSAGQTPPPQTDGAGN
jgi:hypothetical protein